MSTAPDLFNDEVATFGEPIWDVARLFPPRGSWTEADYFALSAQTHRPIELCDGQLEVLPMPTTTHQRIVAYLYRMLWAFVSARGIGTVYFSPLPVRLGKGKLREPDILFMFAEHAERIGEDCWDGADLVMEVTSQDRHRDLEVKRLEYAQAGIPEYWIVDPRDRKITVLALEGDAYAVHGEFTPGQKAASRTLPGFEIDVTEALG